jgi:hypothetical protein
MDFNADRLGVLTGAQKSIAVRIHAERPRRHVKRRTGLCSRSQGLRGVQGGMAGTGRATDIV